MGLDSTRKHKRVRVSLPVEIFDILNNKDIVGRIIDISAGGVALITNEQLTLHSPISLTFEVGGIKYDKLSADVVREIQKEEQYFLGIAFFNMCLEEQEELDGIVRRLYSLKERGMQREKL
ncbi:MAG: PilZ domain-containing protein [Candidatus Firestonebacteria bacterium]